MTAYIYITYKYILTPQLQFKHSGNVGTKSAPTATPSDGRGLSKCSVANTSRRCFALTK